MGVFPPTGILDATQWVDLPPAAPEVALCSQAFLAKRCKMMIAPALSQLIPGTLDSDHPYVICPVLLALGDVRKTLPAQLWQSPWAPPWTC